MFATFKSVLTRSSPTLLEDAVGCLSLVIILYLGLVLPGSV